MDLPADTTPSYTTAAAGDTHITAHNHAVDARCLPLCLVSCLLSLVSRRPSVSRRAAVASVRAAVGSQQAIKVVSNVPDSKLKVCAAVVGGWVFQQWWCLCWSVLSTHQLSDTSNQHTMTTRMWPLPNTQTQTHHQQQHQLSNWG